MQFEVKIVGFGSKDSLYELGLNENCSGFDLLSAGHSSATVINNKGLFFSGVLKLDGKSNSYCVVLEKGQSFQISGVKYQIKSINYPLVEVENHNEVLEISFIELIAIYVKEHL